MAYEMKNNTGTFFNNDKKSSPKSPCFKGSCVIDGKKLYMAIWENTSASGGSYWSVAFSADDKSIPDKKAEEPKKDIPPADLDDDIPWN